MLLSYRSVHSVQHILTDRLQLANQPFGLCLTLDHELAVSGLAAIVRKAQKVEGLRATLPGSCSPLDGEPPELDQPGLVLVDRQTELLQPVSQCREELLPIPFLLTADRQIVRISTDDDLTGCLMSAPVVYPKIDDIMEEDVGEERADPRSLRRPDLHRFPSTALEDAGLEPPLDQAEDSRVSDPVPQHPNQPSVVDGVEEGSDVEIEHPVHALRHHRPFQGCQGGVRAAPRPEAVAEPQEVRLVDRIQHLGYRPLDNLVFERGNAEGPAAAVAFRDVRAAYRLGPVLSAVDPFVQALKVTFQRLLVLVHRHPIDPGAGGPPLPSERPFERGNVDVMQQCCEPRLARASGRVIHTPEVRQQGLPAQCRPFACSVVIPSCRPLLSITSFPAATSPILWSGPTPIRDAASYGCPSFAAPTGDRPVAADGSLRFRHEPFGRDLALAPGGASRPLA